MRTNKLLWFNAVLGAVVVAVGVVAYLTVGSSKASAPTPRTTTVQRGVVMSSVSATGNVQAPDTIPVDFKNGGTLTAVYVKQGQHVERGRLLAKVDPTDAKLSVQTAEASLATAEAQRTQTLQTQTPADERVNQLTLVQSRQALAQAKQSIVDTKQSSKQGLAAAILAVSQAESPLRNDRAQLKLDQAQLKTDQAQLATDTATYDTAAGVVTADKVQLATDTATQQADQSSLQDGQNAQSLHNQQLSQAQGNLTNAQTQLKTDQDAGAAASVLAADQTAIDNDTSTVNGLKQQQITDLNTNASRSKAVTADGNAVSADNSKLSTDQTTANTAQSAVNTDTAAVKTDTSAVKGDETKIASDKTGIANAKNNLSGTKVKNAQSLHSAQNQLAGAKLSLQMTLASIASKAQSPGVGSVAAANASVQQAQVNLQQAQLTLAETTLRAPAAGTIASVGASVGETVSSAGGGSASASSSAASSGFITLTDLTDMQVLAGFSETDAANIRVGQAGTVTVGALPNEELAAHVIAVDTNATVVSNVVTYDVTFAIDNPEPALKPGMTAQVDVVTSERDNVLNVQSSAVTGTGDNATVTVLKNGQQVRTPVVAGLKGDSTTEIVSGVPAGTTVVLPSVTLSSGTGLTSTPGTTGAGRFGAGGGAGGFVFGAP